MKLVDVAERRFVAGRSSFPLLIGMALIAASLPGAARSAPGQEPLATQEATTRAAEPEHQPNADQVLEFVMARATAVFSGRFDVLRSTGYRQDENSRLSQGPYRFSLSGEDWARRALEEKDNLVVNRDGQRMLLYTHPIQDDGSRTHGAQMRSPIGIREVEGDSSPFFAGTFWSQLTLDFVAKHRDQARIAGREVVDGHETVVLELPVKLGEAFEVLSEVNGVTYGGGVLRVYAAPTLGYALPRIDLVGQDGTLGCQFASSGFDEFAAGIWFPKKSTWQWYDPKPAYYEEYEFSTVSLVNEAIPAEDFEFSVPARTSLADMRDPTTSALITVESPKDQPELEALLAAAKRYKTTPQPAAIPLHPLASPWRMWIVLANVAVGIGLIAWMLIRRRQGSPRTN